VAVGAAPGSPEGSPWHHGVSPETSAPSYAPYSSDEASPAFEQQAPPPLTNASWSNAGVPPPRCPASMSCDLMLGLQ
jgi:hypothetical protein